MYVLVFGNLNKLFLPQFVIEYVRDEVNLLLHIPQLWQIQQLRQTQLLPKMSGT